MEFLNKLKVAAFQNGVRLYLDACLLAQHERNESALALAVLAYEELGKCLFCDRVLDNYCMNGPDAYFGDEHLKSRLREHVRKLQAAAFDSGNETYKSVKHWDGLKQAALYTDLIDGKEVSMPKVSGPQFHGILVQVLKAFEGSGDVAFFGVAGETTEKSEWLASREVARLREAFAVIDAKTRT